MASVRRDGMKGGVVLEARRGTGPGGGGLVRGGVTGVDGGRTGCPWGASRRRRMARARSSWAVRVWVSRAARFLE